MNNTRLLGITAVLLFVLGVCLSYAYPAAIEMVNKWAMGWFEGIFMIIFWLSIIVASAFLIEWHLQNKKGRLVPAS